MGKRNPVTLVSAVVKRKSAVVTGSLFEANNPPTTINPLPIATRVIMTCKIVYAPTDIPRIMEVLVVASSLVYFNPRLQQRFASRKMGSGIIAPGDYTER